MLPTPRALRALWLLVSACLARDPAAALKVPLREACRQVPPEEWLAMIRRQRLVALLQAEPLVADLLPSQPPVLRKEAWEERFVALILARFTSEIALHLHQAGLPVLVIKGVPLALQDPAQLTEAIRLLQELGFRRSCGEGPLAMGGLRGRYFRWVSHELSLRREKQTIDLHWALSHARADLPSFAKPGGSGS